MEWTQYLVAILVGLAAVIPLTVKLIEYVKKAAKEKNWKQVMDLVLKLMQTAEEKFDNGADRKEWVLAMVKASADTINYDINLDEVSDFIDSLCEMSKVVNADGNKEPKV